ncbi:hypothetical protein GUJ93_ZPchr0012g18986 [Zizania palustris]|uniref:Uncharacterized protein n=1 Tax=Zizania palustris TaxID=103762 RepID=A0A8J5WN19_ZIZPA|nr:hypothetical protein GUJ93_ZPchr0012g18986 [Zizania palustris]
MGSWLTYVVGFVFLAAVNSVVAVVHRSEEGDVAGVAFVAAAYLALAALFWCVLQHERAAAAENDGDDSPARTTRYKAGVWLLSTLLTTAFAWRVSGMMPWPPAAVVVWVMAASTVVGGFCVLFVCTHAAVH